METHDTTFILLNFEEKYDKKSIQKIYQAFLTITLYYNMNLKFIKDLIVC